jgi:peptide/nickel transport system substrate-binding protein
VQCDGFVERGRWCNREFDRLLAEARSVTDVAKRQALYREAADIWMADRPHIVLYHYRWLWAARANVQGFVPHLDGLIRVQGVRVGSDPIARPLKEASTLAKIRGFCYDL